MTPDRLFRCLNWKVAYSEWGKSRIPMCWKLSCGAQLGQMDAESFQPRVQTQSSVPAQPPVLGVMPWLTGVVWPQKSQEINESQFWAGGKVTEMNTARKLNSLPVTACRKSWGWFEHRKTFCCTAGKETSRRAGRRLSDLQHYCSYSSMSAQLKWF